MTDPRGSLFTAHWGTFRVRLREGRPDIRPWEGDPDPPEIGAGMAEMVDHPLRIRQPMLRLGVHEEGPGARRAARGAEPFVAVDWDTALDLAAAEIDRVRRQHGNAAIFGGSYGWASAGRVHHAQSHIHRFLNCIGGYTASIDTYSYAAVSALTPHVVGPFRTMLLDQATSWDQIARHTRLMVMFGGIPVRNAQVNSGGVGRHTTRLWLRRARANGCAFVNVGPGRDDVPPELGAEWLALRPGTDTALMLALAHVLEVEGLTDTDFLARCTTGYERFRAYLLGEDGGQPRSPEWAAPICGIPAQSITALARRMAASRCMITMAWSVQRADHGEQPAWMAITLAAMLGQIGLPGGGFGIGYGSENGIGNPVTPFRFPAIPQGRNPVAEAIPVARIADALLLPGAPYDFNGRRARYPDLRLILWAGGNPFHHHQDLGRLVRALRRPETIIVNEIWWTPMARHADIVFPATTALEREDIAMTHWEPVITAMRQVMPPLGQARDDYDIFAGLARRLGAWEAFTEGRSAADWLRHLWEQTRQRAAEAGFTLPDLDTLRAQGMAELPPPQRPQVLLAAFRADPEANPLPTPSGRIEIFSRTIAGFGYPDCPGHPAWLEPREWLGAPLAARYPLHLISSQPRARLHAQLDAGPASRATKVAGREPIMMHPEDAARRGLAAGDVVRVFNDRGACLAGVVISDALRPGVVRLSTGAWYDPDRPGEPDALCKHGNPNVLTRDAGSSALGQGPSAQSVLVEVERCPDPPPVTAHLPPRIIFPSEG
ncbi:MAG: Asp-tRNA(Asn)/Glu-tRNA(Gln) amidotransferase GatCAB subunit C [Alphaproteobacteria bacterium]|nr:MAG: Asp-tRNA(Asn)/Glu-tRNA(Gln) amidotransferase GatCAB subunit C [Alphaproteobacteria bacterium]